MVHLCNYYHMIYVSTDINECMEYDDLCAVNATCTNTIGTYQCSCDTGFTGDGVSCSEPYFKSMIIV